MTNRPLVLIVEDDPIVAKALERQAQRAGFLVAVDSTGWSVLQLAKELQPVLVVLDLGLPAADGREILAQLKEDTQTSHIEVVMLSGMEDQFSRVSCLQLGAEDYEAKPPSPIMFERLARRLHDLKP